MPGDIELLLRVGVGATLGEALGTEREHRGQVAGCGRTAWWPAARRIFMLASAYRCAAVHRGCNVDPMRVAAHAAAGRLHRRRRNPQGGASVRGAVSCTTSSATSRARLRVLPSLAVRAAPGQQQCAGVGGVADEPGTFRLNVVSTARPPAPPTRTRRAGPRCRRRRHDQRALPYHGTLRTVASHTSPC